MSDISMQEIKELIKLKKEKPKEYEQFMIDAKEIFKDVMMVQLEIAKEMKKNDSCMTLHNKFYAERKIPQI